MREGGEYCACGVWTSLGLLWVHVGSGAADASHLSLNLVVRHCPLSHSFDLPGETTTVKYAPAVGAGVEAPRRTTATTRGTMLRVEPELRTPGSTSVVVATPTVEEQARPALLALGTIKRILAPRTLALVVLLVLGWVEQVGEGAAGQRAVSLRSTQLSSARGRSLPLLAPRHRLGVQGMAGRAGARVILFRLEWRNMRHREPRLSFGSYRSSGPSRSYSPWPPAWALEAAAEVVGG